LSTSYDTRQPSYILVILCNQYSKEGKVEGIQKEGNNMNKKFRKDAGFRINPVERSRGIWSRRKGAEKDLSGMKEVTKLATAGLSLEDVFEADVGSEDFPTGFREQRGWGSAGGCDLWSGSGAPFLSIDWRQRPSMEARVVT